jgi:hypothetical protein
MNKGWGYLAHRDEHEISKMKPWVRKRQEFSFHLLVIIEEQIEVDGPRFLE